MKPGSSPLHGAAQKRHFDGEMAGSDSQHAAQHDAVRARQGNSSPQTTHEACRTILAVSRPMDVSA
jgi:hypothetical protein